jgi:hypothetical protein
MTDWKERDDATTTIDDVVTTNQRLPTADKALTDCRRRLKLVTA